MTNKAETFTLHSATIKIKCLSSPKKAPKKFTLHSATIKMLREFIADNKDNTFTLHSATIKIETKKYYYQFY